MDYQINFCGTRASKERYCLDPLVQANDYDIIRSAARPEFAIDQITTSNTYSLSRATVGFM